MTATITAVLVQVSAEISRNVNQHIEALRERERTLLQEVQQFRVSNLAAMTEQANAMEEYINTTQNAISTVSSGLSEWTDIAELKALEHTLNEQADISFEGSGSHDVAAALTYTVSSELLRAIPLLGHVHTCRAVASRCIVEGQGLLEAWKARPAEFTVTACDLKGAKTNAGGDLIEVIRVKGSVRLYHTRISDIASPRPHPNPHIYAHC